MDKLKILEKIKRGFLTQKGGAIQLGLRTRQVRRLLKRIYEKVAPGIKRRMSSGSNRSHSAAFKENVLAIVRNRYIDFGPSFASE
jgi:hypothetical protein